MKIQQHYFLVFLLCQAVPLSFTGCTGRKADSKPAVVTEARLPAVIGNETALLLKDLADNGDFVNSKNFPSLIKASIVHESLDKNILVVDLRSPGQFLQGHLKGAVNKKFEELPTWFESGIRPFEYDKIVMVCDDGQVSSYTTCLLRLMGYGNVYAMRWGMSSWNSKYAKEGWLKGVSGQFESGLENKADDRGAARGMPELNTGMNTGAEIGAARFRKLTSGQAGCCLLRNRA